jgi:hypothetical protein
MLVLAPNQDKYRSKHYSVAIVNEPKQLHWAQSIKIETIERSCQWYCGRLDAEFPTIQCLVES